MGMYTELVLSFELKEDTPDGIINTLLHMIRGMIFPPGFMDDKFLDKTNRLKYMLSSSSYYFAYPESLSKIYSDSITHTHHVSIRCNLKNYENEIELFLKWITPYINNYIDDFLGYSLYEEDRNPILIYLSDYV